MKAASAENRAKSAARLHAVQALYQMERSDQTVDAVRREFEDFRFGLPFEDGEEAPIEADAELFGLLLEQAVNWQSKIDQMMKRSLAKNWPIERIDPTLRALFRAAGAELVEGEAPPKVVISEFVEVAKAFFPASDGREAKFVNAVLDSMAREARPEAF